MKPLNRTITLLLILSLALMAVATNADAARKESTRGSIYFLYNGWSTEYTGLGDFDIKQTVFGLNTVLMPSESFRLQIDGKLSGNSAKGQATFLGMQGDADVSFSSINDTRVKATFFSANQATALSIYAGLPTGKTELSLEQYAIVTLLSDASRKYIVRRVGQGLDLGGEGLLLPHFGDVTLQLGGAFFYRGPYRAREIDTEDYKYGNEVHGIGGFDYDGRQVDFSGNVTVIYYFKDKYGDEEIYQSGITQIYQVNVQYTDMFSLFAGGNFLIRGAAKLPNEQGGDFIEEQLNSGRNEMLIYGGGSYPVTPELSVLAQLELKSMSENEYPQNSFLYRPGSSYVGLSGGAGYRLTEVVGISGMLSYYSGSIDGQAGVIPDADLSGFGATIVMTVRAQ